jgi:hypothetical protein
MGERLFEPTATKMATISSDKAASATPREQHPKASRPLKLPRASTADAICKWSGENRPNRSRDPRILARYLPHREEPALSSWEKPLGTTKTPAGDGSTRIRVKRSQGEAQASTEDPQTQEIPSESHTKDHMHSDPPPLMDEGDQRMPATPHNNSTQGIERVENETGQWASPIAHLSLEESQESTVRSLYYFTAASELSTSTQESFWGLDSTNDGVDEDIGNSVNLDGTDLIEMESESIRNPSPIRALLESYEYDLDSSGSEQSWNQERSHPTLKMKYKPINTFFEKNCTKPLVSTQPQAVATIVLNKRRKNWPYLGGIKQLISRLFMTRGELAIITSSWKMPRLTKQICNRAQNIQQMLGKAMQQVILLRRCFFPRRDVIKWSAKLGDKYAVSEVVLI